MASWTFRNLALSLAAFVLASSTALAANPSATTTKPKPIPQLKAISPSQAKTDTVRRTLPVGVDPGAMDNAGGPSQSVMDDLSDAPPPNLPAAQPWTDTPKQQPQWQTNVPTQNAAPTKPSTAFPSEDMIPDFNKPFPSAANQAMQAQPAHPPQPVYPQFQQLPPEQPAYPQYQQVPQQSVYPQFTQPQQPMQFMQAGQQPMYPQFQQQMPMQPPAYPQYQQPYPQYAQQMPMQQIPAQQGYPQFQQQMPMQTSYPQFQQQAPAQPVYPQFQQQVPAQPIYPQFQQQQVPQGYPQFPSQFAKPAAQSAVPAKKPTTAAVKKTVSDAERVSRMEKIAFGKVYSQEEVADRVDRLETKVFGKPKDGAVHQRISGLEKALKVGY
ncbi:MAG: hypothetical protein K2Y22_02875 [Candidatus Obscuribacterales bacterium]|nr:hypothetical protein [Candidatus Obscuribacterales bacterium]